MLRLDAAGPVTAQEVRTRAGGIDCLLSLGVSLRPLRVPRRSQLTTFWLERVWQDCRESACYRLHLVRHGAEQRTERTQIRPLRARTLSFVPRLMCTLATLSAPISRACCAPSVPCRLTFMCVASTFSAQHFKRPKPDVSSQSLKDVEIVNPVARYGRFSSLFHESPESPFSASELRHQAKDLLVEVFVTALLALLAAEFIELDFLHFITLQWTFSLSTRPFMPRHMAGNVSAA